MKPLLTLAALLVCGSALAESNYSYNYLQFNWIADSELDESAGSVDGDGFSLEGSWLIADVWYIKGEYTDLEYDASNGEASNLSLGIGGHSTDAIGDIEVFGTISYEDVEVGIIEDDGFGIEVGARALMTPNIEGYIAYDYNDYSDGDLEYLRVGGIYALSPAWGISVEYLTGAYEFDLGAGTVGADRDEWSLGLRYNF